MQRRHNCSPAVSFANSVMTLYLLKVHLQTFLSVPITQKCQILSCDILVANKRNVNIIDTRGQKHCTFWFWSVNIEAMQEKNIAGQSLLLWTPYICLGHFDHPIFFILNSHAFSLTLQYHSINNSELEA